MQTYTPTILKVPPSAFAPGPWTRRSSRILRAVEDLTVRLEERLGRQQLLNIVEAATAEHVNSHIDFYRGVVRGNAWPNEARQGTLASFFDGFERGSLAYVRVGFESLRFLGASSPADLNWIARRVIASEALRSQFGKSSPSGLDVRLEEYADLLAEALLDVRSEQACVERDLLLLGTPVSPQRTAEAALLEDFSTVVRRFPDPPSADQLVRTRGEGTDEGWRFIRWHTRWSVRTLHNLYAELSNDIADRLREARLGRQRRFVERKQLISQLHRTASSTQFQRVLALADVVTAFNHLNLALEPSFSFKGNVGLPHGLVFRMISARVPNLLRSTDQVVADKWALFGESSMGV